MTPPKTVKVEPPKDPSEALEPIQYGTGSTEGAAQAILAIIKLQQEALLDRVEAELPNQLHTENIDFDEGEAHMLDQIRTTLKTLREEL